MADTGKVPLAHMPAVAALPLPWAGDQDKPDPWQTYVVKEIYPRFLYIFSDVVCYVTRNTKYVLLSHFP